MKISNTESIRAGQIAPVSAAPSISPSNRTADSGNGAAPAATVELSAQAQALSAAKTEAARFTPAVTAVPDTRDDLVASLKARVDAGTYHVSSSDIADQIVRRSQADRIR